MSTAARSSAPSNPSPSNISHDATRCASKRTALAAPTNCASLPRFVQRLMTAALCGIVTSRPPTLRAAADAANAVCSPPVETSSGTRTASTPRRASSGLNIPGAFACVIGLPTCTNSFVLPLTSDPLMAHTLSHTQQAGWTRSAEHQDAFRELPLGTTEQTPESADARDASSCSIGGGMPRHRHGPMINDSDQYEALRAQGMRKEKAARISNASYSQGRSTVARRGARAEDYEDRTKDELLQRAREIGV